MAKHREIHIEDAPKSWWSGDDRVEPYMPEVKKAIRRHIKERGDAFTDIYNRCYEAIYKAICDYETKDE